MPAGSQPLSERMLVDEAGLAQGSDFSVLHDNYDNLLAASDAAINDANLAVHETGKNAETGKRTIEHGYTYGRIQKSIQELDRQSSNIDRALTLADEQINSLKQEIETRTRSLQEAGQNPEQDPTLNLLKNTLQGTVTKMETLLHKSQEMQGARQRARTAPGEPGSHPRPPQPVGRGQCRSGS